MLKDFGKEALDIVIQAGQSNAEGCGIGPADDPFMPSGDILYLDSGFMIFPACERIWSNDIVGDFSLAFCSRYIADGRLGAGRKLLVVRAAVGGTGFLDNRWKPSDDLFLQMLEMAKTAVELSPRNRIAAFLWHQGETDATLGAGREEHLGRLAALVGMVRDAFGCSRAPFVAGDFVGQWKEDNLDMCAPVVEAVRDACARLDNARFVETAGLQSNDQRIGNGDTIHFCRDALNKLGERYYSAFADAEAEAEAAAAAGAKA
ncbi:MAG: sialate O-acetylesterase [Clostridiales bacterium]|jgi:hypothetical protein|nr:sialate O-acetylesterase [Clostridiales bacterium]